MPATPQQITQDALTLPEPARAELAQTLLQSLDTDEAEEGVEEAWEAEVARRFARLQAGAASGRPAADVFRELRARHRQ